MFRKAHFASLLDKTLEDKFARFEHELGRCRETFSETATHDLRISLRRLISALDVAEAIAGESRAAKTRKLLKNTLDMFGDIRDTQVKLLRVKSLKSRHRILDKYEQRLKKKEETLIAELKTGIEEIKIARIRKGIKPALKKIAKLPAKPSLQEELFIQAYHFVDERFHEVLTRMARIDRADLDTIHEMRLSFKRFRYAVEALKPVLGGVTKPQLDEMHSFQQMMGEINDLSVLRADLNAFANIRQENPAKYVTALREIDSSLKDAIDVFMKNTGIVRNFWTGHMPD